MAPDKIYVPTEYTDNDITPVGVTLRQVFPNDVCYIRKEALLEWLDGKLTIEGATEGYVGGYDSALKDVIDKLNKM